jgi:hypothetical protein
MSSNTITLFKSAIPAAIIRADSRSHLVKIVYLKGSFKPNGFIIVWIEFLLNPESKTARELVNPLMQSESAFN